jgi:hypothetical protein
MSEAGLGGLEDLQDFLSVQRNPRKSQNQENPASDKMSEAGFVGLED